MSRESVNAVGTSPSPATVFAAMMDAYLARPDGRLGMDSWNHQPTSMIVYGIRIFLM
jgi:hypothetical protein